MGAKVMKPNVLPVKASTARCVVERIKTEEREVMSGRRKFEI